MKRHSNIAITWAAIVAILTTACTASALNIAFIVGSDGVLDQTFDQGLVSRLTSQGHTVTVVGQEDTLNPALATADLYLVSNDISGSTFTGGTGIGVFRLKPYVTYEYGIYGAMFDGTGSSAPGGANSIIIQDDTHPLAAGLEGTIIIYTGNASADSAIANTIGPGAQIIGTSAHPSYLNKANLIDLEVGQVGNNGVTNVWGRRIAIPFFTSFDTNYITSHGWRIFDAAIAWAVNTNVIIPPTVTITNPISGASFASNANITLSAQTVAGNGGAVASVTYYANGVNIGMSTTPPSFDLTWSDVPTGYHMLTAKVKDVSTRGSRTTSPVEIKVGSPPDQIAVIAGSATLGADDQALTNRISALGFSVSVLDDDLATTNHTPFARAIVISSSVSSGAVGTKFNSVPVGVYSAELFLQDDMLFTGPTEFIDYGAYADQANVVIAAAGHPLAGGLSGTVGVMNNPVAFAWGAPTNATVVVANLDVLPTSPIIYGFETNALLYDGVSTAPGRRVQTFFQGNFAALNTNGLKLFDAGMAWVTGITNLGSPPAGTITSPTSGQRFPVGNIPLTITATDPNGDNTITNVEYFVGGTNLIATSTASPFSATWSNVTTGYYELTAKVTDNSGRSSTTRKVRNVIVGNLPDRFLFVTAPGGTGADRRCDLAMAQRISALLGYNIIEKNAVGSVSADADGVKGIFISSLIASGDVLAKFNNSPVPLINCEGNLQDDIFLLTGNGTVSEVSLNIVGSGHPMTGGLSNGVVVFNNGNTNASGWAPDTSTGLIPIAASATDPTHLVVYGVESGTALGTGSYVTPARRVNLGYAQNDTYDNFTAAGFILFDAALKWAMNTNAPALPRPVLNPPVTISNGMVISWTGVGVLDQATAVGGPYTPVPWPISPYTNTPPETRRFFRLRQ